VLKDRNLKHEVPKLHKWEEGLASELNDQNLGSGLWYTTFAKEKEGCSSNNT
jgi:hypothetical protein